MVTLPILCYSIDPLTDVYTLDTRSIIRNRGIKIDRFRTYGIGSRMRPIEW